MARLLHTSDTHLGYRQYHLDERRRDFADAFHEVVSAAINENVDAVVHAGDLFHTSRPGIIPLQTVLTELQRLQAAEIPFLLIVGNHERTHDRNWVELLAEVGLATRLDATGTRIDDTTVYGLDFVPPGQRDRLQYDFDPAETESAVLVGHGLFKPFGHGDWGTQRILEKSPVDFDIMLVGDDHGADHRMVRRASAGRDERDADEKRESGHASTSAKRIPLTYAGSTERTMADQRQPRTYSIVSIPENGDLDPDAHIDRRVIDSAREFVYVDVPLHRGEGIDTVEQTIRDQTNTLDNAVLKVTLMVAEDDLPIETGSEAADADGESTEPATHERVPVGPIENLGASLGALITRVSDRRNLLEDGREYQAVEFADVDAAVEERRQDIVVTEAADQFLEMAMNTDQTVDSNVADTAEETVKSLLETEPLDSFYINRDDATSESSDVTDGDEGPVANSPGGAGRDQEKPESLLEDALEDLED